jgi:hypothetical protein
VVLSLRDERGIEIVRASRAMSRATNEFPASAAG